MKPTLSDIAKHIGVSAATVSLALNKKPNVKEATRIKVLAAAKELNYIPDVYGRALATRRSNSIGLIVPDIDNPFYTRMTTEVDKRLREQDRRLILGFSNGRIEQEEEEIKRLISLNIDGIMISPVFEFQTPKSYKKLVEKSPVPIVYLAAHYDFDCHWIMTDLEEGSYLLTCHILQRGARNLVFLSGREGIVPASLREKGILRAFEENGVTADCLQIIRSERLTFDEAYEAVTRLLEADAAAMPDAIMTANDFMSLGAMRAVRENGLKVPDDIAIAGFDDVIYASIAEVPLTTVRQPISRLASKALEILSAIIISHGEAESNNRAFIHHNFDPELVIRNSTTKQN